MNMVICNIVLTTLLYVLISVFKKLDLFVWCDWNKMLDYRKGNNGSFCDHKATVNYTVILILTYDFSLYGTALF